MKNIVKIASYMAIGAVVATLSTATMAHAKTTDPILDGCRKEWANGSENPGDYEASFMAACFARVRSSMLEHHAARQAKGEAETDPVAAACVKQLKNGGENPGDYDATFMASCFSRMRDHLVTKK